AGPAWSSGTGSARATRARPARARTAAPAPRRRVSAGGTAPSGSGPSPTAATSGAVTAPNVASLVTSPTAPVAPSNSKVAVSCPSNAATTLSHPAATSSSPSWARSAPSRWCTPITIASTASSAGSVSKRLRRGSVTALIVTAGGYVALHGQGFTDHDRHRGGERPHRQATALAAARAARRTGCEVRRVRRVVDAGGVRRRGSARRARRGAWRGGTVRRVPSGDVAGDRPRGGGLPQPLPHQRSGAPPPRHGAVHTVL